MDELFVEMKCIHELRIQNNQRYYQNKQCLCRTVHTYIHIDDP